MTKKIKHYFWHISSFSVKITAVCGLAVLGLIVAFVWRVTSEPLDISFANEYLQAAMYDHETGNHAVMDKAVLYWPDLKGPLYLELKNGQLLNKNDQTVVSVDSAALSFSRYGLITGRILPKSIILKQPTLQLVRRETGEIEVDLGKSVESETLNAEKLDLTTRVFGYIARPGYESAQDSLIARLQAFEIENARLVIDDRVARQSWSLPDFNLGLFSTEEGMNGRIDFSLPDVGLKEAKAHIDMRYIWDEKNVNLSADFENIDLSAIGDKVPELAALSDQDVIVDAHLETLLDEEFTPTDIRASLTSEEGELVYPDFYDAPLPYENLGVNVTYNYPGKTVVVRDTAVTLNGITFNAQADITHNANDASGPVKLWVDEAPQSALDGIWPKPLRGDDSEKWVVQRMSEGTFKDIELSFLLQARKPSEDAHMQTNEKSAEAQKKNEHAEVAQEENAEEAAWSFDAQDLKAKFAAENMRIDYHAPLMPAHDVVGKGRFDLEKDTLFIDVQSGKIGEMRVSDAVLFFDKVVAVGEGGADLSIPLEGKIADVMRFISTDPINLGDDIDMDISQVRGNADLDIKLKFPAQKDVKLEDFTIDVDGTLREVNFPDVIETLDLSGGPLAFEIKDGLARLNGDAMLDKRPMEFSWSRYLESEGKPFKEKISAKITADPNIRQKLGIDLSTFLEGSVPVDVTYTSYRDRTASASVSADATPALFFVEPFDFQKKIGEQASVRLQAHFKNGDIQKITDMQASGAGFDMPDARVTFAKRNGETELKSGRFNNATLAGTTGNLEFVFDQSGAVNIVMKADVLDARPFMDADKVDENAVAQEYDEPPMVISVTAKTMRTAENEVARNAEMFFDIDNQGRYNQIEVNADVGAGAMFIRFKPDEQGKRTFRMKTNDAGAMLKAFQVYNNIRGGEMVIYGEPVRGVFDRDISGTAEITNFRVVNAPFLAQILSLLSLGGIGEVLENDGLNFDKLESGFRWEYKKGGSLLVLNKGRTSGNALGLLFDGTFDNARRMVDVSGTVVPMSGLNEVIGNIPLVGDILTGGSGGVFAATFSIEGSSDDPKISVNPLSVIAPGIIRRILFE